MGALIEPMHAAEQGVGEFELIVPLAMKEGCEYDCSEDGYRSFCLWF